MAVQRKITESVGGELHHRLVDGIDSSDTDLMLAAQKTETYLRAQMGTVSGTVTKIEKKKGQTGNA